MKNDQSLKLEEYESRIQRLAELPKIKVSSFGKSIMDRSLEKLEIGEGEKKIVLLGGVCGQLSESNLLTEFAEEYLSMIAEGRRVYGTNPAYLSERRSIIIYPLVNPDAAYYRIEGVCDDNPIIERLLSMNKGSEDFSEWRANGRGVSLERNSPIGFDERKRYENANLIFNGSASEFSGNTPESEPELCSLIDDVMKYKGIKILLQISEGKDSIYSPSVCEGYPGGARIRKSIQRVSGIRRYKSAVSESGIVDMMAIRLHLNSYKLTSDRVDLRRMRDLLYTLPLLI